MHKALHFLLENSKKIIRGEAPQPPVWRETPLLTPGLPRGLPCCFPSTRTLPLVGELGAVRTTNKRKTTFSSLLLYRYLVFRTFPGDSEKTH